MRAGKFSLELIGYGTQTKTKESSGQGARESLELGHHAERVVLIERFDVNRFLGNFL